MRDYDDEEEYEGGEEKRPSFKGFLAQNAKRVEYREVVISDRFVGDDGKPLAFKIRPVSDTENEAIKDSCIEIKQGNRAARRSKQKASANFRMDQYHAAICAAGTVEPDLNNPELQNSYGAASAEELIGLMLLAGEGQDLYDEIMDLSGFVNDSELVEDAKN